jgi:hypothetical protein
VHLSLVFKIGSGVVRILDNHGYLEPFMGPVAQYLLRLCTFTLDSSSYYFSYRIMFKALLARYSKEHRTAIVWDINHVLYVFRLTRAEGGIAAALGIAQSVTNQMAPRDTITYIAHG